MEHFVSNPENEYEYEFTFTIIMAVYNVEPFIAEAIDSLINQDIGFEYHVQLILVDDGSPDGSGEICDEYQQKYPDNIEVIHKENGGVSSARNAGIPLAKGKYVNFMDPDDKLSLNTLREVFVFFGNHYEEIDVVVIPLIFFDGRKGEHPTNAAIFKKKFRIVDLTEEYKCILLSMSRTFVKNSKIIDKVFDSRLKITEDGKVLQEILLSNQYFGAIASCKYFYRKRSTGVASAIDSSSFKIEYYCNWMEYYALNLLKTANEQLGYVPLYVQFTICYDIQFRAKLTSIPAGILTDVEKERYYQLLRDVLQFIENDIIMIQQNIFREHKMGLINFKYRNESSYIPIKDDVLIFRSQKLLFEISKLYVLVEFINIHSNYVTIEGRMMFFNCSIEEKLPTFVTVNGERIDCTEIPLNNHGVAFDEVIFRSVGFKVRIPIDKKVEKYKVIFYSIYKENIVLRKEIRFGKFSPIGKEFKSSYYYKDGRILSVQGHTLYLKKSGLKSHIKQEKNFLKEVGKKYPSEIKKIALVRAYSKLKNKLNKKQVWLLSDSIHRADDNGKIFFQYLCKKKPKKVKLYFVIAKHSPDYNELKKYGKVVDFNSNRKKLLHLQATKIISSAFDEHVINPFEKYKELYRDLLVTQEFIFLQHGIIKDDMSSLLDRYKKNCSLFVTSALEEYQSILECDYYYSEKNVLLSGLPRYDSLYHNSKKLISIMPTWRRYLASKFDTNIGVWKLNHDFQNSSYFQFYNELLNHKSLLVKAKELNYTFIFMPHPNIAPHIDLFSRNENVEFICYSKPYREIYAESDLIINDYSSASFDFSYLRKPVIYTHFDKDEFFLGRHSYIQGYFDYERDGFGEVEYDIESTVARIIEYMENGCQLKDKYRERIDNFFAFNDQNNCERVYNAIMDLDKEEEKN